MNSPLKVLHLHQGDAGWGGGQMQMLRLQQGLREAGVDSRILCRARTRDDSILLPRMQRSEKFLGRITKRLGLNDVHCVSAFRLPKLRAFQEADVLDIHCIHEDFFSYLALPKVTAEKPVVYTLHDMWPFTGHCHQSLDCGRWETGCGKCPYPEVAPAVRRDATRWEWRLKDQMYRRSNLVLISPTQWLAERVRRSMMSRFEIHIVPHGIDTRIYRPLDRDHCRSLLGIPPDRKVVAFVVDNLNRRLKGGDLLLEALGQLPPSVKENLVLLLLGKGGKALERTVGIQTLHMGYVAQDLFKVMCYSAADLYVLPTRTDNLPLTLLESIACGTPVVSFRVGGVPEVVRPGVSGFLAEPENAAGLADGLRELLQDDVTRTRLRRRCRQLAEDEYDIRLQVGRYLEVFSGMLGRESGQSSVISHQSLVISH